MNASIEPSIEPLEIVLHPVLIWPLLKFLSGLQSNEPTSHVSEESPHRQLLEYVLSLTVIGYEQLIAELLKSIGYSQIKVLRDPKRKRRSQKGRNRHGGVDITDLKPG